MINRAKDHLNAFVSDEKQRRIYECEALALEASELISRLMDEQDVNKTQLAQLLGTSKSNITNLLAGTRNMTMHTLADLAFVLGNRVEMKAIRLEAMNSWQELAGISGECAAPPPGPWLAHVRKGETKRVRPSAASLEDAETILAA